MTMESPPFQILFIMMNHQKKTRIVQQRLECHEAHTSMEKSRGSMYPKNIKKRDLHILVALYFSIFFGKYILRYTKIL